MHQSYERVASTSGIFRGNIIAYLDHQNAMRPGWSRLKKAALIDIIVAAKILPPPTNNVIFSLSDNMRPQKRRLERTKDSDGDDNEDCNDAGNVGLSDGDESSGDDSNMNICVGDGSSDNDENDATKLVQILWDTTPIFNRTETEMVCLPHNMKHNSYPTNNAARRGNRMK